MLEVMKMKYKEKILMAIEELEDKLIEREELIRLCVLCIFSRHHMFLIGVPGVGKTYAIQIISKIIKDGSYWEKLLSKETKESDLVGNENTPIEETILHHPFLFFDEMFKAPDDLLVSLLSVLNERYYTRKGKGMPIPLSTLFSASNELPFGEKIEPFSDRLLVWYEVNRIHEKKNKQRFINGDFNRNKEVKNCFLLQDIEDVCILSKKVSIPENISDLYFKIQDELIRSDIQASDRKFGFDYIMKALKVCAILNDRDVLNFSDLLLVRHMSWTQYSERNRLFEIINNVIFGDRNKIESTLMKIIDFYDKKNSFFNRECFKFINHLLRNIDESTFNDQTKKCLDFKENMELIKNEVSDLENKYQIFLKIKEEERDNVLLLSSNFYPFTQETLTKLNEVSASVNFALKKTDDFLEENPDVYFYQKNQSQKGVVCV